MFFTKNNNWRKCFVERTGIGGLPSQNDGRSQLPSLFRSCTLHEWIGEIAGRFLEEIDYRNMLPVESGGENALFLEFFNDIVVPVASAAPAVRQPVDMDRRRVILARNGTIDFPVAGKEVTLPKRCTLH